MEMTLLFPHRDVEPYAPREGDKVCPKCEEGRLTGDIYRKLTYLCGYSRQMDQNGWVETPCQGKYFYPFIVSKENSSI